MEIQEIIRRVDELIGEIDTLRPISPEQEQRIMQKFRLDWTFHSNAIEGNSLTYGETRAFLLYGVTAQGKPFKDYLDIKGHHQALDYLVEFVRQEQPLTEAIIREIHKIVLVEPYKIRAQTADGLPTERTVQIGQYKSMPNHVITQTGETHFYASPEETPARMGDLMAWYRQERDKLHPLILAATFHYEFVAIHPFDDGNGRMARLLMNLILMQAGYPPVVIRIDNRPEYYLALAQADAGELDNFITLVGNLLVHSLQLFLRGAKGQDIEEFNDLDKKLALLQQQIEGLPSKEDSDDHASKFLILYKKLIEPFLSVLLPQLMKFDTLFTESNFTWQFYEIGNQISKIMLDHDPLTVIVSFKEIYKVIKSVERVDISYEWVGFAANQYLDISILLSFYFPPRSSLIMYYILSKKTDKEKLTVKEGYVNVERKPELDQFLKTVTNDVYLTLEQEVNDH